MDAYIWRVPTLLGVSAGSALVLFAAAVVGSEIVRRRHSIAVRTAAAAALGALVILAGLVIRTTAVGMGRVFGVSAEHVDPGLAAYPGPVLFAAFAYTVARWLLNGRWISRAALTFYAWLLIFTALNIINWCTPGWCETIGFPFTWSSWSDFNISFADERVERFEKFFSNVRHIVGAALNLLTFVFVARALALVGNRSLLRRQSG